MFKGVNKVIRTIIYWDLYFNSAWGLINPVFAVFIMHNITSENVGKAAEVAGFAALVYWVLKSFLQIPIGAYLDKNHGEHDDFIFTLVGTIICGLVPIGYIFASLPEHIYLLQGLFAIAMSMLIPSSYAIFTRHIDKGKEAVEWSLDSTVLGFGAGITGALGGIIAGRFGFTSVFILASILNFVAAFSFLAIKRHMSSKNVEVPRVPPTMPAEQIEV
ncbi:MAG: MFS transporter [Candidatus Staskawiczbacteria bacterium]|nr:MFS transporter [Candidatus Staskawiczbacteria bacterium]